MTDLLEVFDQRLIRLEDRVDRQVDEADKLREHVEEFRLQLQRLDVRLLDK